MITKECSIKQSIVNASFQMTAFSIVTLFATCYQMYMFPNNGHESNSDKWLISHSHLYFPRFISFLYSADKNHSISMKACIKTPHWLNRSWFQELLNLLMFSQITFPVMPDWLGQLQGKFLHQIHQSCIHSWKLSNNPSVIECLKVCCRPCLRGKKNLYEKGLWCKMKIFSERAILEWNGSLIIKTSPNVVTDFLIYAYSDQKRQVSTIKGYKFMIFKKVTL